MGAPRGKFYSRAELVAARADWKRQGKKVVFTNGCYDLLHPGHIRLLEQARSMGDVLILALNTDASVQRLKGPARPLLGEQERAAMALALEAVDAVALFDEDTPRELILRLRPEVIVKGGDYEPEGVVGAAEAKAWQGEVHIVSTVDGLSTTRFITPQQGSGWSPGRTE